MGSCDFSCEGFGKDAKDAFWKTVENAQYDHGHSGYSGTIAEKDSFVMIDVPEGESQSKYAQKLIDEDDGRVSDKWGPAGCIDMGPSKYREGMRRYIFFGWASS